MGIKKRMMREQGLDFETEKQNYELDHAIPLALGGQLLPAQMVPDWDTHRLKRCAALARVAAMSLCLCAAPDRPPGHVGANI